MSRSSSKFFYVPGPAGRKLIALAAHELHRSGWMFDEIAVVMGWWTKSARPWKERARQQVAKGARLELENERKEK